MERDLLLAVVEAALVTSRGPVAETTLIDALADDGVDATTLSEVLEELRTSWAASGRGVRLERVAGGWRCVTPPELDPYLRAFHGSSARQRLSQAALEVLAIVAYRQPVTAPEISFIRGVSSGGVLRTLQERHLVRVAGRKQVVGRPFLFRTTREFLVHFGLDDPKDLPDPEDLVRAEAAETAAAELSGGPGASAGE